MARRCTICDHESAVVINKLLCAGKTSNQRIADDFRLSETAVWNHRTKHLAEYIKAQIRLEREEKRLPAKEAHDQQVAETDDFMDDIRYSKRFAKQGIERTMGGVINPETGEVAPAPIDELRLAPGFLAALDRANSLLGQATGRLNAAPSSVTNIGHLSVVMPRALEPVTLGTLSGSPTGSHQIIDVPALESPSEE